MKTFLLPVSAATHGGELILAAGHTFLTGLLAPHLLCNIWLDAHAELTQSGACWQSFFQIASVFLSCT